jgi:hypothetical protein
MGPGLRRDDEYSLVYAEFIIGRAFARAAG